MAQVERLTVLKVSLEDRPGTLLAVLNGLKEAKINLAGMWGFSMGQGRAQLLLASRNPEKLQKSLSGMGMNAENGTGFYVKGSNRPGALVKTIKAISDAGINIEAADALAAGDKYGSIIWVKPDDVARVEKVLGSS